MGFGFTSPVSGLAPIQIGWSGTLVPLRGTTLADGNDHKSHRESAVFQRQQGSNQTGSKGNAKALAGIRREGLALPSRIFSVLKVGWPTVSQIGGRMDSVRDQAVWRVLNPASLTRECHKGEGEGLLPSGCHIAKSWEHHVCGIFLCTKKKAIIFMGF